MDNKHSKLVCESKLYVALNKSGLNLKVIKHIKVVVVLLVTHWQYWKFTIVRHWSHEHISIMARIVDNELKFNGDYLGDGSTNS